MNEVTLFLRGYDRPDRPATGSNQSLDTSQRHDPGAPRRPLVAVTLVATSRTPHKPAWEPGLYADLPTQCPGLSADRLPGGRRGCGAQQRHLPVIHADRHEGPR